MKIKRLNLYEVKVPTHPGTMEGRGMDKPLHKLPIGAKAKWSVQFDQIFKIIVQLDLGNGIIGWAELYRNHVLNRVEAICNILIRIDIEFLVLQVVLPYILHGQRIKDSIQAIQQKSIVGFNFNCGPANFQRLDHIATAAELPCWHGSEIDPCILEAMYVRSAAAAESCIWPSDIFGRSIREHDLLISPLKSEPPYVELPIGKGLVSSLM
ncbi:hypothetical protein MWU78_21590 [Arenibacter sp. F26102]|uniref:hypothetical protein n=1 Tax=Arenibacter sp. F26102 TaxID=2926416 RepID=UPI001FF44650|nr:hypothetical protein [Arenibacter sp. F26102]MCK0148255.1 hypothetical protein [Arenibacter sp. F26102]